MGNAITAGQRQELQTFFAEVKSLTWDADVGNPKRQSPIDSVYACEVDGIMYVVIGETHMDTSWIAEGYRTHPFQRFMQRICGTADEWELYIEEMFGSRREVNDPRYDQHGVRALVFGNKLTNSLDLVRAQARRHCPNMRVHAVDVRQPALLMIPDALLGDVVFGEAGGDSGGAGGAEATADALRDAGQAPDFGAHGPPLLKRVYVETVASTADEVKRRVDRYTPYMADEAYEVVRAYSNVVIEPALRKQYGYDEGAQTLPAILTDLYTFARMARVGSSKGHNTCRVRFYYGGDFHARNLRAMFRLWHARRVAAGKSDGWSEHANVDHATPALPLASDALQLLAHQYDVFHRWAGEEAEAVAQEEATKAAGAGGGGGGDSTAERDGSPPQKAMRREAE